MEYRIKLCCFVVICALLALRLEAQQGSDEESDDDRAAAHMGQAHGGRPSPTTTNSNTDPADDDDISLQDDVDVDGDDCLNDEDLATDENNSLNDSTLNTENPNNKKRSRTPSAMKPDTYDQVFIALKMGHRGATKASKQDNKEWYKVSRLLRTWPSLQLQMVQNPVSGHMEERIVIPATDNPTVKFRIIIKTDEVEDVLNKFFIETVGDGASKLSKRIQKLFVGLNERNIQSWLNTRQAVQQNRPLFNNCAPLIPIMAKSVMERNQIDLVDMRSISDKCLDYNYVLSIIDVFSRYLILKPLRSKSSEEIADILETEYNNIGPPHILQSDQGTEFKGAVQHLMSRLGVKVIHSAPYKPQSQGKSERSHPIWKSKLRLQLEELCSDDEDYQWVDSLDTVTRLYNEGYHSSLGMSPFEVFYGRKSNRELNVLCVGQQLVPEDIEVEEEEVLETDMLEEDVLFSPADGEELEKSAHTIYQTRQQAKKKADLSAMQMVARNLRKNPPSSYNIGEQVFLRVRQKGGVNRGGNPLSRPLVHQAKIVDVNRQNYKYKVQYTNSKNKTVTEHVSVNNITSLTRADEKQRQLQAKKKANCKSTCMCPYKQCKRHPGDGCKYNMNAICCRKQGNSCHFHGVIPSPKTPKNTYSRYNLSAPGEITRVFSDFAKDIRLALKMSESDNHNNLDSNIASAGLAYREPRTPGDGNCMFHALADQLRLTGTAQLTHEEVRAQVVAYLRMNQETSDGTHMREWIQSQDWERYLSAMSRDREWGDEVVLVAASNMFNVDISIISSLPGDSVRILTPSNVYSRNIPTLLMAHLSEVHYYSLQNVNSDVASSPPARSSSPPARVTTSNRSRKRSKNAATKRSNKKSCTGTPTKVLDARVATLAEKINTMVRSDVISQMDVPVGPYNNEYISNGTLADDHSLLGVDDISQYWASLCEIEGTPIPIKNGHFHVSSHLMDKFLEFRDDHGKLEKEDGFRVFYINIVVMFWLFTTHKMHLLKEGDQVDGSFLYLSMHDADILQEFREALLAEWQDNQRDD